MKLHKITIYSIGFNGITAEEIINLIDNNRFFLVAESKHETVDIGEWKDDNILNYNNTPIEVFEEYFSKE